MLGVGGCTTTTMKILYATDGSPGAAAVGEFLARLALAETDHIILLAVQSHHDGRDPHDMLSEQLQALHGSLAGWETEVRSGSAAIQILECAGEQKADLIALGAIGNAGLARFFIGSTAERVLRHASVPVLVGRPVRYGLRQVLVGVDSSAMAARVVTAAAGLPLPRSAGFRIATVIPPQGSVAGAAPMVWAALSKELDQILRAAVEDAESRLQSLAGTLQKSGRAVSAEVLRGEPATSLIQAAEREETDLLVLGSHGEGGVDRFLLGSNSERVARHAQCSVLVVR